MQITQSCIICASQSIKKLNDSLNSLFMIINDLNHTLEYITVSWINEASQNDELNV